MTRSERHRRTLKKNIAYRTRRALRIISKAQPKTVEEAQALGIGHLQEVGQGAFRTAYKIWGTSLLIKFPLDSRNRLIEWVGGPAIFTATEGKNHTRMEVKKIRALLQFPMWRKHLPPVLYFNSRDGVMVTKFYRVNKKVGAATGLLIGELAREFCGVTLGDVTTDNVRVESGRLVLIDLGY